MVSDVFQVGGYFRYTLVTTGYLTQGAPKRFAAIPANKLYDYTKNDHEIYLFKTFFIR